jgi:hypothetical protein
LARAKAKKTKKKSKMLSKRISIGNEIMEASSSINQINVSFGSSLLKMLANGGSG